jgi:hypothetical protein
LAFFAQTTASFCKNCDHNIGFWEKRQFFRRKLSKIAENCDHNIDPRSVKWPANLQLKKRQLILKWHTSRVTRCCWGKIAQTAAQTAVCPFNNIDLSVEKNAQTLVVFLKRITKLLKD